MRRITLVAEERKDSRGASRKETHGKALGETYERVSGDTDWSGSSECRKKWSDSVCNLDVELVD